MRKQMAFEKECDFILRLLNDAAKNTYTLAAISTYLRNEGFNLSPQELMSAILILSHDEHVQTIESVKIEIENGVAKYYGGICISAKGAVFILNSNYENEKERNDLLFDITISNAKIQSRLLHINRWIAFGGIVLAVSSILEIARNYYNPILPILTYYVLPFLTFLFLIWLLYLALLTVQQRRNKNK